MIKLKDILFEEIFESTQRETSNNLPSTSELTIVSIETVEGKNKWGYPKDKLVHMVFDLGDWEEFSSAKIPKLYENIKKYLPSMDAHRCSVGRKGGFFSRVKRGTWLGHIIEHIALELQTLAGDNTGFGRTRGTGKKGEYNVIFNYENKKMGIAAANEAVAVVKKLIHNQDPEIKSVVKKLKSKK